MILTVRKFDVRSLKRLYHHTLKVYRSCTATAAHDSGLVAICVSAELNFQYCLFQLSDLKQHVNYLINFGRHYCGRLVVSIILRFQLGGVSIKE